MAKKAPQNKTSEAEKLRAKALESAKKPKKDSAHPDCKLGFMIEEAGLTLRTVASACGMSPSGIFRATLGGNIWLTHAQQIARFFGADIDKIWPPCWPINKPKSTKMPCTK